MRRRLLLLVPLLTGLSGRAALPIDDEDADERVRLFATAASLAADGRHWLVPLHLEVFEPEEDDPLRAALLEPLRRELASDFGGEAADRFRARARLFVVDHERGERRTVVVAGHPIVVGPTAANGQAEAELIVGVDALPESRWIDATVGNPGEPGFATTRIEKIGPDGWSVISDIDDTLKITEVAHRLRVLRRTFLEEFEAVPGMAALLGRLAARGAAFHYVSLAPWQLDEPLREFLAKEGFPAGTLDLQRFRLQDGELGDLLRDSKELKLAVLEPLLARWPKRRFLLIGDSGQSDPELFGELLRRHPDQVAAAWIRIVPDPGDADSKAAGERLAAAFRDVPAARWRLFDDPAALPVDELLR